MNVLNRIAVVLILLALATLVVSFAVLAWVIPEDTITWLRDAVDWLEDNNKDGPKVLLTLIAALAALVAFTTALVEFLPSGGTEVRVVDVEGGNVVLSTASIGQRVDEAVRSVANVSDVRSSVRARRKGVEVSLDLHVDPDARLASVAEEAIAATRRVLAEQVHVELVSRPVVRLHYRELRLAGRAARPTAAATPASAPTAAEAGETPAGEGGEAGASEPEAASLGKAE